MEYLDLYLIHSPNTGRIVETWDMFFHERTCFFMKKLSKHREDCGDLGCPPPATSDWTLNFGTENREDEAKRARDRERARQRERQRERETETEREKEKERERERDRERERARAREREREKRERERKPKRLREERSDPSEFPTLASLTWMRCAHTAGPRLR